MERETRRRGRSLTLVLLGVVLGSLFLAPAGAHLTNGVAHLFRKHIKPKTDGLYLSKDIVYVRSAMESVDPGGRELKTASCPSGTVPISGGVSTDPHDWQMEVSTPAFASGSPTGWTVLMENEDVSAGLFLVYAICANGEATISG